VVKWYKNSKGSNPSVQKSNEGSYCCTVSNCAGSETSECAILTVGKIYFFVSNLEMSKKG